jgi:lysophospholipase L1-like esterase
LPAIPWHVKLAELLSGQTSCLSAVRSSCKSSHDAFLLAIPLLAALVPAWGADVRLSEVDPRWRDSFSAFEAADRAKPVPPNSVIFLGSSSIRLWDSLESQFEGQVLVKRGFGGSQLSDCLAYLDRLVLAYQPRLVVVYAGDNDLAAGRTPEEVLQSYIGFIDGVHRSLPQTRIAYISIKPSPARAALLPQIRHTNALIRQHAASDGRLDYIDVFSPMLGSDGQPRSDLFRTDGLHLDDDGYALWRKVIATHLR